MMNNTATNGNDSNSTNSTSATTTTASTTDLVLPIESAEFVMKNAKSVQINPTGIENLANKVGCEMFLFLKFFIKKKTR